MSHLERLSPVREHTGDPRIDRIQQSKDEIVRRVNAQPLTGACLITGTYDAFNVLSDGVTFTAGQTLDLPHGLGSAPSGFLVVDARGSAPLLYRDDTRPADEQQSYIRLKHTGASSTTVKLVVF